MNWCWGLDGTGLCYFLEEAGIIRADTWNEEKAEASTEKRVKKDEELRRQRQMETQTGRWDMSYCRSRWGCGKTQLSLTPFGSGCEEGLGHTLKDGQAGSGRIS